MNKLQFSVLSYYPSVITDENINVAILFHNVTTDEREFYIMKNWKRLETFDDEVDIDFMKLDLKGMRIECENNIFNNKKSFDLEGYIKFYVNELKFDKVNEVLIEEEETQKFIEDTKKVYMKLDFTKNERISKDNEVNYIKKYMKARDIKYRVSAVKGHYDEDVQYDYIVNDYGFKNFVFQDREIKRMIANAKTWAYTAEKTCDYKTVFVYDEDIEESKDYKIIMKILSEYAYRTMKSKDVIDFIVNQANK